uniref:Tetratricopeptide repeat domain 34 n=1 Tax=Oryctolagus cuniculus TaxID=9986 RepID=G1TH70_RABIT
ETLRSLWEVGAWQAQPEPPSCRDARGVYQLASLLMELDVEDEAMRLLAADALYHLGCLDDAHGALQAVLVQGPQAAMVLVQLALVQLRRGFSFEDHQLVKRLVQARDTACLQPTLDVFCPEDLQLLQGHCHTRALAILQARPGAANSRAHTRDTISDLSLQVGAGSQASESLLARALCYSLLGQMKTAMFDFNSVLRAELGNMQALCGWALMNLALAVANIISALKLDLASVVPELHSLRRNAQGLLKQDLHAHCWQPACPSVGSLPSRLWVAKVGGPLSWGRGQPAEGQWEGLQSQLGWQRARGGGPRGGKRWALARLTQALSLFQSSSSVQASAREANALLDTGRPRQALGFCSLAMLAGGGGACHLRLRATCLAQLRECDLALRDLDQLLQEGAGDGDLPRWAEDLCSQGRLLLSLGDEVGAAAAFSQALTLAPAPAQSSLWGQPCRTPTVRPFLHQRQRCLEQQRHVEAWTAAQRGLLVDPGHRGLKQLKARAQRGVDSGCWLH